MLSSKLVIRRRTWISIGAVVLVLIAANVVFYFYPPNQLVDLVGVENTYLTIFLIAAIGGVNTFTSGVLYASLLAFAAGGANPYWLGLACGIGIAVGDTLMYWLFRYGTNELPSEWEKKAGYWKSMIERYPKWLQLSGIYFYLGFLPLPNDVLMFILASLRFKFLAILPVILLGGVTFATLAALFGEQINVLF